MNFPCYLNQSQIAAGSDDSYLHTVQSCFTEMLNRFLLLHEECLAMIFLFQFLNVGFPQAFDALLSRIPVVLLPEGRDKCCSCSQVEAMWTSFIAGTTAVCTAQAVSEHFESPCFAAFSRITVFFCRLICLLKSLF